MKKVLSLILSSLLVFSCTLFAFAGEEQPTVSIQNTSAQQGEHITVQVIMENNPGLITLLLRLNYDTSVLTLESAADGIVFGEGNAYFGNDLTNNPYMLMWEDGLATSNYFSDGTLATLTFAVAENAQPGQTEIEITVDEGSTFNMDLQTVPISTQNGTITVADTVTNDIAISIDSMTATVGSQIEVPIRIQNNHGLVAVRMFVSYDTDCLTLINVEDGGLFGEGNSYFGNNATENPYVLMWEDALSPSNYTQDGILATLTFSVSSQISEGQTPVILSLDTESTFDVDLNPQNIELRNSTITINKAETIENASMISVGSVVGKAGETVQVPITIQNNPGLIASKISISYDKTVLTLINVADGTVFGNNNAYFGKDLSKVPYVLFWEDALSETNYTINGVLAMLTFKIADNADGKDAVIGLQYDLESSLNVDLQEVPFTLRNGKVSVAYVPTTEKSIRIFSFEGSFDKKIKWWKRYSKATMMLGFNSYNCNDAVRFEWTSDNWRVVIDQDGNITNKGSFARSAKITLTAYDADGNVVATSTVTVRFYKFNWQVKRLQSQTVVSDNVFKPYVEDVETEPETFVSILSAFFSKVFWFIIK